MAKGPDRPPDAAPHVPAPIMSRATWQILAAIGLAGAVVFVYAVVWGDALRAWQTLLVNFLFFAGLAQAGVVLSAVLQATAAVWARPLKRAAEATLAFVPVSAVLLVLLFAGMSTWAPWITDPATHRATWLSAPAFVGRQLIAFIVLAGLSLTYLYHSLRPDIGMVDQSGTRRAVGVSRRLIAGWRGTREEIARGQRRQDRLAPAVLVAYGWVYSLVAFDFVMALDPHWYSTLAGGYFFTGNLLLGVAFLTLVAVCGAARIGLTGYVGPPQLHDLGKLLFGFSILWAYLLWSQYLVIWYGDLPEETAFVIHRMSGIWASVSWAAFTLAFVVPFVVLLSRRVKTSRVGLGAIAAAVFAGMWMERFVLVSPSLWHAPTLPIGLVELVVTGGVFSLFILCYTQFLRTFPALAVSDPRLQTNA